MKRLAACCAMLAMAGCAGTPPAPPGTLVAPARLEQTVQPGVTTKAMLLAQLGATTSFHFDSGYEVWCYLTPAAAGNYGEYVIVLDPRGVVAKVRRAPAVYQSPQRK